MNQSSPATPLEIRDPDMANVEPALRRAAIRARRDAFGTSGYVVVCRDGRVIEEPVLTCPEYVPYTPPQTDVPKPELGNEAS
jgi:hypothetical protein